MRFERPDVDERGTCGPGARMVPVVLALCLLALAVPQRLAAQYEKPPPAAAYGLEGVTVVRADGTTLENVNLVVRNGRIAAVGPDVAIPASARVLEGESLSVYPGMIDASGAADYELPEADTSADEVASWNPPRDVQRFRPHLRVADHLASTGSSVAEQREAGIVAAAVHPEDGPAPGRSALLLHRKTAKRPRDLVLDPELGGVLTLEPAPGVYPGTLFGVMAFHRQQFRNAEHHSRVAAAYDESPAGLAPPAWDADYRVLDAMAAGRTPVFFRAQSSNDIRRALDLASGAGFDPVILGGREAWKVADMLAGRDVPVLATTDYPQPQRWDPEADSAAADTLEPEVRREKRRVENAYRNAARLHEAGVTFALTTGGGDAELREGVRTAVEYGLPEDAALRAVTSTPAEILGRPALSSVREGVAANFVVADGPLFAEETELLYTFVDGRPQVMREEPDGGTGEPPAVDVTGTWSIEISMDQESFEGTMELKQDEGGEVDGSFSPAGQAPPLGVEGGSVSGSTLDLTLSASAGGETIEISLTGTVEGEKASGTGSGPFGSFTWEATRESTPGGGTE